jgi:uncharacterized protein YndB with AHSA1/START domain
MGRPSGKYGDAEVGAGSGEAVAGAAPAAASGEVVMDPDCQSGQNERMTSHGASNKDQREPTGSLVQGPEGPTLQIQRTLDHSPEDVWSYLADPELLRWYGTYTGDPESGSVQLAMVEAPDHPGECVIEVCERPSRLHVTLSDPNGEAWRLRVSLDAAAGGPGTDLVFRQPVAGFESMVGEIGPGWEYYLDRLTVALRGGDVDAVDFADFYPGQKEHYTPDPTPPLTGAEGVGD